jgi:hypothetical protein
MKKNEPIKAKRPALNAGSSANLGGSHGMVSRGTVEDRQGSGRGLHFRRF